MTCNNEMQRAQVFIGTTAVYAYSLLCVRSLDKPHIG